jgi:hypothetical protein
MYPTLTTQQDLDGFNGGKVTDIAVVTGIGPFQSGGSKA